MLFLLVGGVTTVTLTAEILCTARRLAAVDLDTAKTAGTFNAGFFAALDFFMVRGIIINESELLHRAYIVNLFSPIPEFSDQISGD